MVIGLTHYLFIAAVLFCTGLFTMITKRNAIGILIGVELVRNRTTKEPAVTERDELVQRCFYKGLLLLGCGKNTLRLCPPLVISHEQAESAVRIIDEALGELTSDCEGSSHEGDIKLHAMG